jgi:hypothetical protein
MSELGMGDERSWQWEEDSNSMSKEGDPEVEIAVSRNNHDRRNNNENVKAKQKSAEDAEAVESLPIVIIRNYALTRAGGSTTRDELLNALAHWAASLAENQVRAVFL